MDAQASGPTARPWLAYLALAISILVALAVGMYDDSPEIPEPAPPRPPVPRVVEPVTAIPPPALPGPPPAAK